MAITDRASEKSDHESVGFNPSSFTYRDVGMDNSISSSRTEDNRLTLKWPQVHPIGAGLHNMGNTCFLNSALQCLTYTPPLANYMLARMHSKTCHEPSICIMCSMENHINQVFANSGNVIFPMDILTNLTIIAEHFNYGSQEDAHEFLHYTLEAMQRSCSPETTMDRQTIIDQVFGGCLRSRVKCSNCKAVSDTFEPFLDLALDITEASSVSKALKHFVKSEKLGGENSYKCSKCNKMVTAKKGFKIHRSPNVLTLSLKRFTNFSNRKITKDVKYPEVLDLQRYMSQSEGEPQIYGLYAVLVHSGAHCHSGHYFCYTKASDGQWYKMNDSTVSLSDIHTVLKEEAYLLFYIKSPDMTEVDDYSPGNSGQLSPQPTATPQISTTLHKYNNGFIDPQLTPNTTKISSSYHGSSSSVTAAAANGQDTDHSLPNKVCRGSSAVTSLPSATATKRESQGHKRTADHLRKERDDSSEFQHFKRFKQSSTMHHKNRSPDMTEVDDYSPGNSSQLSPQPAATPQISTTLHKYNNGFIDPQLTPNTTKISSSYHGSSSSVTAAAANGQDTDHSLPNKVYRGSSAVTSLPSATATKRESQGHKRTADHLRKERDDSSEFQHFKRFKQSSTMHHKNRSPDMTEVDDYSPGNSSQLSPQPAATPQISSTLHKYNNGFIDPQLTPNTTKISSSYHGSSSSVTAAAANGQDTDHSLPNKVYRGSSAVTSLPSATATKWESQGHKRTADHLRKERDDSSEFQHFKRFKQSSTMHHKNRSPDMTEVDDYSPGNSSQLSPQPAATPQISSTLHKYNNGFIDPQLTPNTTKISSSYHGSSSSVTAAAANGQDTDHSLPNKVYRGSSAVTSLPSATATKWESQGHKRTADHLRKERDDSSEFQHFKRFKQSSTMHHKNRSPDMTEVDDYSPGNSSQLSPQPAATPQISSTLHKYNNGFIDPQLTPNTTKISSSYHGSSSSVTAAAANGQDTDHSLPNKVYRGSSAVTSLPSATATKWESQGHKRTADHLRKERDDSSEFQHFKRFKQSSTMHHKNRSPDMTEVDDYSPGNSSQLSPQPAATPQISSTLHKYNNGFIDPQLTPNTTKISSSYHGSSSSVTAAAANGQDTDHSLPNKVYRGSSAVTSLPSATATKRESQGHKRTADHLRKERDDSSEFQHFKRFKQSSTMHHKNSSNMDSDGFTDPRTLKKRKRMDMDPEQYTSREERQSCKRCYLDSKYNLQVSARQPVEADGRPS